MPEQHAAGDNIASYCTKCKLNLDHAIVAMVGETIAKVKCKTCGSVHKYKDPSSPTTARTRTKKESAGTTAKTTNWDAAIAEAKGKEVAYNMAAKFQVGDIVNHDKFGKGVVMKIYPNKCDVLFQDRERLMATGN